MRGYRCLPVVWGWTAAGWKQHNIFNYGSLMDANVNEQESDDTYSVDLTSHIELLYTVKPTDARPYSYNVSFESCYKFSEMIAALHRES